MSGKEAAEKSLRHALLWWQRESAARQQPQKPLAKIEINQDGSWQKIEKNAGHHVSLILPPEWLSNINAPKTHQSAISQIKAELPLRPDAYFYGWHDRAGERHIQAVEIAKIEKLCAALAAENLKPVFAGDASAQLIKLSAAPLWPLAAGLMIFLLSLIFILAHILPAHESLAAKNLPAPLKTIAKLDAPFSPIFAELHAKLPNTAYVESLEKQGKLLTLHLRATAQPEILQALLRVPAFSNLRLQGAIKIEAGEEIFTLSGALPPLKITAHVPASVDAKTKAAP